jgi:hypothetical protein
MSGGRDGKGSLGSGGERSQAAGAEAAGARSVQAATTQGLQEKRGAGGRGFFMSAAAVVVATAAVVGYPGQDPLRQRLARRRTETPGQAHTAPRRGEFLRSGCPL